MNNIKKNFTFNIILTVTQVVVPMVMYAYVSRMILPFGVGEVSFAENLCRYIMLFAALGIPIYGVREIAKNKNKEDVFNELVSIHLFSSIFFLLIFIAIIFFVPEIYQSKKLFFIGISLIISNVFAIEWFYQGSENFKFITIRTLFIRFFSLILVFLLIKKPEDYVLFFSILCLSSFLNGFINFLYSRKFVRFKLVFDLKRLKKHLKPLLLIFASTASISVYVLLDSVFLGFLSSKEALGYYSLGLRVSKAPIVLVTALGTVLIPKLSQAYSSGNIEYFNKLIQKSFDFVGIISFPLIVFMIAMSNELILVFAGEYFLPAKTSFIILSVVIYLIGVSNIFGIQMLTTASKDSLMTKSVFLGLVCSVVLNFTLIPYFNEVGAAVANIASELCVTLVMFYFVKSNFSIKFNYRITLLSLLFSLPIFGIVFFIDNFTKSIVLKMAFAIALSGIYEFIVQFYIIKEENFLNIINKLKGYARL